jgi:cytochrome c553
MVGFTLSIKSIFKPLFILLALLVVLAACSSGGSPQPPVSVTNLPPGDASRGATLFAEAVGGAPACSTCHHTDTTTLVGPGMEGYGAVAGTRVSGQSAEEYTLESITHPASFITPGFANAMYNNYSASLAPQDMADLMAYLLTL